MNQRSIREVALATFRTAAQDQYCPLWEVVDEVAHECGLTRGGALEVLMELRAEVEAMGDIKFFASTEPYGEPITISADALFSDGLLYHNKIGDGPPYFYVHQILRAN